MLTRGFWRRAAVATITSATIAGATLLLVGSPANAAGPTTIAMGTDVSYSVLGASTVTNTGPSVLEGNVGLSPGPSITGFPPGVVTPPSTVGPANDAAAQQAQVDLAAAYADAVSRPVDTTEPTNEIGAQTLAAGVYETPGDGPLTLTGGLVLDGNDDPNSVFIFQTGTTLTTASNSTVTLINGAQECNVFWQIGTSATLGTGTDFAGNILAATSITATTGVAVHGRALAAGAAVTLDTNAFSQPTCDLTGPTTTTAPASTTTVAATTTVAGSTTTTLPASTTTVAGSTTTTLPASSTTVAGSTTTTIPASTSTVAATTTVPGSTTTTLPASTTTVAATTTDPGATTTTRGVTATTTRGVTATTQAPRAVSPTTFDTPTSGSLGIRVVGTPQTGGGPERDAGSSWPETTLLAVLTVAGAIGFVVRRGVRSRR